MSDVLFSFRLRRSLFEEYKDVATVASVRIYYADEYRD